MYMHFWRHVYRMSKFLTDGLLSSIMFDRRWSNGPYQNEISMQEELELGKDSRRVSVRPWTP